MEKNRLDIMPKALQADIRRHVNHLKVSIEKLDRVIETLISSIDEWRQKRDLLVSAPGIGPQVINTLLADLPELGSLSNKQIAALVGSHPSTETAAAFAAGDASAADGPVSERCSSWQC